MTTTEAAIEAAAAAIASVTYTTGLVSARMMLAYARACLAEGDRDAAMARARKSLAFSVGQHDARYQAVAR